MNKAVIFGIIFILVLILVAFIAWFVSALNSLEECRNTESLLCPVFYCGNVTKTGEPGTKCLDEFGNSLKVAYRNDSDGTLQCQSYTVNSNLGVEGIDYSKYMS